MNFFLKSVSILTLLSIAFFGNAQWVNVPFTPTQTVRTIVHTSENRVWGYYAGSLQLNFFYSEDGGNSFEDNTNQFFRIISYLNVVNDSVAYFLGTPRSGGYTKLFRTINRGNIWDTVTTPPGIFYNNSLVMALAFTEKEICLMSRMKKNGCNEIWVTPDGGDTWEQVACDSILGNLNKDVSAYYLLNKQNKTAVLRADTFLYVTHNAGKSWSVLKSPYLVRNTTFMDSLNGIGNRDFGTAPNVVSALYRTKDGGLTWDSTTLFNYPIACIAFVKNMQNPTKNFYLIGSSAGANSGSVFSLDSGKTWSFFDAEPHGIFSFYNSNSGLSYSSMGGMTKYTGPITGIKELKNNPSIPMPFPNPTADLISFSNLESGDIYEVAISDISGRLLMKKTITASDHINLSILESGLYLYVLHSQNGRYFSGTLMKN